VVEHHAEATVAGMLELDTPHGPARAHLHPAATRPARSSSATARAAASARPASCWPRRSRTTSGSRSPHSRAVRDPLGNRPVALRLELAQLSGTGLLGRRNLRTAVAADPCQRERRRTRGAAPTRNAAHAPDRRPYRKRKPRLSGAFVGGAYRDRTGDLRLANPSRHQTSPDSDRQNRHG
jgi:hypothetical protein